MTIDVLLIALEEYLNAKKDFVSGHVDEDMLRMAKKRFASALNEFIDFRIDGVLEERKRKIAAEKTVHIEDLLTSNVTDDSLKDALSSAPPPPKTLNELGAWINEYNNWFETIRREALE